MGGGFAQDEEDKKRMTLTSPSRTHSPTKARDFEGPGGPETKQALYEEANPGNDDVRNNVRQGTDTIRPSG